jgi:hypothetical protein
VEKVVYIVWAPPEDHPGIAVELRGPAGQKLLDAGTRGLQVNVVDDAVTAPLFAAPHVEGQAEIAAVINLWVNSARDGARVVHDEIVAGLGTSWAGYLVTESEPIVASAAPQAGQRMDGFAQMVLLRRPVRLDRAEWLELWQGGHTQVAIDTQSTFRYVQNIVARRFGPMAEDPELGEISAVVEECFPIGAMTDLAVFYDAVDDEERLARHSTLMMESVARFMEPGTPPMVWTSEYILRHRH